MTQVLDSVKTVSRLDHPSTPSKRTDGSGAADATGAVRPPRVKHALLLGALAVLLVLGVIGGVRYAVYAAAHESTDDAFIDGDVVAISPQIAGHITEVRVADNQFVHAGDVLVAIDPRDYQASLAQAQASLNAAQSKLDESHTALGVLKAEVDQATADLLAARTDAGLRHEDQDRYDAMAKGAASGFELLNVHAAATSADAKVQSAEAHVAAAKAHLADGGAQVQTAESQVAQAKTGVDQAVLNLSYATITAPADGRVTRRSVQAGMFVQPGQALLALVPRDVWVVGNFKETQLAKMRPNQPVEIRIDAYSGKTYRGHVDSIQWGTGARFSLLPPENATGNYVKVVQRVPVKILFDEKPADDFVLAPGMSVEPEVSVK